MYHIRTRFDTPIKQRINAEWKAKFGPKKYYDAVLHIRNYERRKCKIYSDSKYFYILKLLLTGENVRQTNNLEEYLW